jgi:hypothetical protein
MSEAVHHRSDPLALLRYVDVLLVVMAAPVVILGELPVLGYAAGAGVWIFQRLVAQYLERKAREVSNVRHAVGLNMAGMFARSWLVALVILAVGLGAEREDGLMAAVTVAVAFTVYFAMSLILGSAKESRNR